MSVPLLSLILSIPLVGGIVALFLPAQRESLAKYLGMAVALVTFALSVRLFVLFDGGVADMQFVEKVTWVENLNISYHLGVDGISILLVALTAFLTPIALLSAWKSITHRVKEFVAMMLFLEVGMLGVFCSLDTFVFYFFWEAMLIPMYFIIGLWGGQNKIYAAVKFFLYTMFGSLLMLVAIIWLGYYASTLPGGHFTTDLLELYDVAPSIPLSAQTWLFLAFTLSFAIKVPMFPFHTWLPDAHVEAPTAGSVILAGVLLKMGTYGLLRFSVPLFPHATMEFLPYLATLGVIGIIYGALVSLVQPDMKKLVAYSSVSHLGFVVLGIFALTQEAVEGSIIQMVNHGLSTGALFLIVGMIYDRRHTRRIEDFGGLAKRMPVYATLFLIVSLSSLGLPGLNGFVGEFLILLGTFQSSVLGNHAYAVFAASGVILAAVYLLWMYQRVMLGPVTKPENQSLRDLDARELAVLVPILFLVVWIGVYPGTFLEKTSSSTKKLLEQFNKVRTVQLHERDAGVPGSSNVPSRAEGFHQ